ncbi:MAG: DNA-protecting protein DprA [Planctomycetes bacterium]|nr:DNA-protecting protein DprA [Planctomycetota bacterium]
MSESPPTSASTFDECIRARLRLSLVPGIGPRIYQDLLAQFGSAEAVLTAAPSQLRRVPGVGGKLSAAIAAADHEIDVDEEISLCQQHDIDVLTPADETYPRLLREIHDPPSVLFARGDLLPRDNLAIAIVGTRHASHYGIKQAERLATTLARAGLTIVSGLARGIDAAAHRGALDANGRTIAVLGSGLLNIYPPEHKDLAKDVANSGAVLSEFPLRRAPKSGAFPQRNRLITGLSLGVIVVEAADRSGALISARLAMEQNREVFAVPGRIDSRVSRGCHSLIRDGARLVQSADDVLEELGPLVEATSDATGHKVHHPAELQLNDQERAVLDRIDIDPTSIDLIVQTSGLPIHRVLSTISVLEMRRMIRRVSGNLIARIG